MKVMAQIAMVMNLDKCIGCHTCSVTCKQAWTNREGTEYMWFNNVETRPGVGYPRTWQDQETWKGGWRRTKSGKLQLRQGGRLASLAKIFSNPTLPGMDDYYEPWTYEYDKLLSAPAGSANIPVARAKSRITGENIDTIEWGPNWDDDLGGSMETLDSDPTLKQMNLSVAKNIEDSFMFYLPRICEHCLNPACVSACPSGAMYKRTEDGIVLVDQDACRGWRMCVSACPYKKVYFNHNSGKAEKCTLCYPRLEAGQPTVCSETCVGRLRYLGVILYDADRVTWAAAQEDERSLFPAQKEILLDPHDPEVVAQAHMNGVPHSWITAAQESPIWDLISTYGVALPLHPEFRTLPMVWYVPPLSPVVDAVTGRVIAPAGTSAPSSASVGAAHSHAISTRAEARPRSSAKEDHVEAPVISGIAHDRSQDKITLVGVPDVPGAAARIFAIVASTDANIDMIVQDVSAEDTGLTNISFTCPDGDSAGARAALEAARDELGFKSLHFNPDIGKLSLVGAGMRSHPGVSARLFGALSEAGVNIHMISTSEIRISVVVDDAVLDEAVRAVHSAFGLDAQAAEAVVYGGTGR